MKDEDSRGDLVHQLSDIVVFMEPLAFLLGSMLKSSQKGLSKVHTLNDSIKWGLNLMSERFEHHVPELVHKSLLLQLLVLSYFFHRKKDVVLAVPLRVLI